MISEKLSKHVNKYIELNILPNLLAFYIARLYYTNNTITSSFNVLYNDIKSLINIINEDREKIKTITKTILASKYSLVIVNEYPLLIITSFSNL